MTVPSVGMFRTEDHRYYWAGQGPYPSVTTIMKTLDKSDALVGWAKRESARFAVEHLDTLVAHRGHISVDPSCPPCMKAARPYDGTWAAIKWVASIPGYQSDAAKDLGTKVHGIAEAIGKGEEPDVIPEFLPYAVQYRRFLEDVRPRLLAVEYQGVNRTYGYAGTGDLMAEIGGSIACLDIKTWTKDTPVPWTYYPETAMQLIACSRFEFIGKPGDPVEYPVPRANTFGVLLIGKDDYRLIPYFPTEDTYQAFLACLRLHAWREGEARTVVGAPYKEAAA